MSELTLQAARRIDPRRVALAAGRDLGGFRRRRHHRRPRVTAPGRFRRSTSRTPISTSGSACRPASPRCCVAAVSAGMAFALSRAWTAPGASGSGGSRPGRCWRWAWSSCSACTPGSQTRGVSWDGVLPARCCARDRARSCAALRIFRSQPKAQAMFGAAIVLWLVGGALDNPDFSPSRTWAPEILEMAAGVLFALSLLGAASLSRRPVLPARGERHEALARPDRRRGARPRQVPPDPDRHPLVTAAFGIQDVLLHTGDYHGHRVADPRHQHRADALGDVPGLADLLGRACSRS